MMFDDFEPVAVRSYGLDAEADAASEDDRRWFLRNPNREYRVRPYREGELHPLTLDPPPDGHSWRIITRQIAQGVRCRVALTAPIGTPNRARDEDLARWFAWIWRGGAACH